MNIFLVFWAHLDSFWVSGHLGSFRLFWAHLGSSAYNLQKEKIQMYQYLLYDYHLVHTLATVWDTSTSISNSAVFLHIVLDLVKQSRFDFSNHKQTFVRIQLIEIDYKRSLFQIHLCQTQVKLFSLSSHTTVDWKHQRCKYTMVYLKDSFIVSSPLFLFVHNIALLQALENPQVVKYLLPSFPEISTLSLFELFGVLSCSSSPDNGVNLGSISVSLHTSDIIFAVWSSISLSYIYKVTFLVTHTVLNIKFTNTRTIFS